MHSRVCFGGLLGALLKAVVDVSRVVAECRRAMLELSESRRASTCTLAVRSRRSTVWTRSKRLSMPDV